MYIVIGKKVSWNTEQSSYEIQLSMSKTEEPTLDELALADKSELDIIDITDSSCPMQYMGMSCWLSLNESQVIS